LLCFKFNISSAIDPSISTAIMQLYFDFVGF